METAHAQRKLLFIEPREAPSPLPNIDSITRKMCAAFRQARESEYAYGGIHQCICRATSSCCDHFLPDGTMTNSLCIHYLAHHRVSVPAEDLAIVAGFAWGEADPTDSELQGPELMVAGIRRTVERSIGPAAQQLWRAGDWTLKRCARCSTVWICRKERGPRNCSPC